MNNVERWALGDWIEASAFFGEEPITAVDIADCLLEEEIVPSEGQELAYIIASEGIKEVMWRAKRGGVPCHMQIASDTVNSEATWTDDPIYAFFLALSLMRLYPSWAKKATSSEYYEQGELFERVVHYLCQFVFPGWDRALVGWSKRKPQKIRKVIDEICPMLNVKGIQSLKGVVFPSAQDAGLDIICFRGFKDSRQAMPTFFIQCASGNNWIGKVAEPDVDLWKDLLASSIRAARAIAIPFAIHNEELSIRSRAGQTVILDRLRLMGAQIGSDREIPTDLRNMLRRWLTPRMKKLAEM